MLNLLDITVVFPTYLREKRIQQTLLLLLNQSYLPSQVIVVNQTPGAILDKLIADKFLDKKIELLWVDEKTPSLCGARNIAIVKASNDICLFLDDDIIFPEDLIYKHYNALKQHPEYVAFGGQVLHRLSTFRIEDLSISNPKSGITEGGPQNKLLESGPLFGGHFSIRTEIAIKAGGWDELFIGSANWEEGDIMNRLKQNGYKFAYTSEIWFIHLKEPGGCRISGNFSFSEWTKSYNFFLFKYRYTHDKKWGEVLKSALRAGPLRKEIVKNPLRWSNAWISFFKGWYIGRKNSSKSKLLSASHPKV